MMDIVTAFLGVGLFGTIGAFLFVSIGFMKEMPSSVSEVFRNPRFIGGCVCLVLTFLCCCAML